MRNKGVMISLAVLIVIGVLITKGTYRFTEPSDVWTAEERAGGPDGNQETAAQEQADYGGGAEDQVSGLARSVITEGGWEAEKSGEEAAEPQALDADYDSAEDSDEEYKAAIVPISPLDTTASEEDVYEDALKDGRSVADESQSYYKKRLQDLDAQIQRGRESKDSSNISSSARTAASNELKLWDSELNSIYNAILKHLDQEQSEKLAAEQRAWMMERDSAAMEAAKNSSGAFSESVEYTASQAASTRERAYELVELYADKLAD